MGSAHKRLSARAKMALLAMRPSLLTWPPSGELEGTHYTIRRDDLELFEIVKDYGDGRVVALCYLPDGQVSPWEFEDFFGMAFHEQRVLVLPRFLEVYPAEADG